MSALSAEKYYEGGRIVSGYFAKHAKFTVVESDCITSPVYFQEYPVELQLTNLYSNKYNKSTEMKNADGVILSI